MISEQRFEKTFLRKERCYNDNKFTYKKHRNNR